MKTVCPVCGSDQLATATKGFDWVVGAFGLLLCGVGVFLGFEGANKIVITCMSCAHEFAPGGGRQVPDAP